MCLKSVDYKPTRRHGIGYKMVERLDGRYLSWDFQPKAGTVEYPVGQWVTDPNECPIAIDYKISYPAGFHVILNSSPALLGNYHRLSCRGKFIVVIKCRFRKVVATGDDFAGRVAVCREIMNLGEVT